MDSAYVMSYWTNRFLTDSVKKDVLTTSPYVLPFAFFHTYKDKQQIGQLETVVFHLIPKINK